MRNYLIIPLFVIFILGNCLVIKADDVSEGNPMQEITNVGPEGTNVSNVQKEAESEDANATDMSDSDNIQATNVEQEQQETDGNAKQDSIRAANAEQERLKAEEKAKQDSIRAANAEQERLKAEEKAKQDSIRAANAEQERLKAEEKAKQDSIRAANAEQERLKAEEKAKQDSIRAANAEQERLKAEEKAKQDSIRAATTKQELKNAQEEAKSAQKKLEVVLMLIIFVLIILILIHRRKKKKMTVESESQKEFRMKQEKEIEVVGQEEKKTDTSAAEKEISVDVGSDKGKNTNPPLEPIVPPTSVTSTAKWVIVGASVKGNGHIQSNMPCQDNHMFESLNNGWGIAIVSDGAGSAAHSELGSKIVVSRGIFHFKNLIEKERWIAKQSLPTDIEWFQKSYAVLKDIRNDVMMVAQKNNIDVKSLSATCLVVIYSPFGLLTVHIGDGRMGYKSMSGEWKSMMTPHKGEEANQTIFLVSDFWSIPNYEMSGVLVPECRVIRENVKAFALMSDGCENTAWLCSALNSNTGKYEDRNLPFDKFFNPLEETLLTFDKNSILEEERQSKWYKFIESGTSGFTKEQDDKTMIYAINVDLVK